MTNAAEPSFQDLSFQDLSSRDLSSRDRASRDRPCGSRVAGAPAVGKSGAGGGAPGVLKAMSPGVVDFLFRRLVAGESAEDVHWHREGTALSAQPPGAELARRLAETDLEALTPTELFHYVRAAQRLSAWAESLRQDAVGRYCDGGGVQDAL
ncbi:hypothetical protein [Arthrobacter sp. SO5]|uniref:hypothetical protein n=1 Tax=Arthrobacter sp. SO5 TaxID=1897055 RepID=UPI001E3C9670|nr:hypothetical protein [Arthrobacter sp. SO5]